jgi:hypothetical protein
MQGRLSRRCVGTVVGTAIGIADADTAAGGAFGCRASAFMSGRVTATTVIGIGIAGIDTEY